MAEDVAAAASNYAVQIAQSLVGVLVVRYEDNATAARETQRIRPTQCWEYRPDSNGASRLKQGESPQHVLWD
jgi:hypothetical protein